MENPRPETGPMEFVNDWPGTFIRGDESFFFKMMIEQFLVLNPLPEKPNIMTLAAYRAIEDLADLLGKCDTRQNPTSQHAILSAPGYRHIPGPKKVVENKEKNKIDTTT